MRPTESVDVQFQRLQTRESSVQFCFKQFPFAAREFFLHVVECTGELILGDFWVLVMHDLELHLVTFGRRQNWPDGVRPSTNRVPVTESTALVECLSFFRFPLLVLFHTPPDIVECTQRQW
ncbi:MAG: hypothetical protein AAGM67_03625, partial [Bacteroidota bacterium]